MILNLKKLPKLIEEYLAFILSFLLVIGAIACVVFYNNFRQQVSLNYKDLFNNTYFKKTVSHIFNNLTPRYKVINHKISSLQTFDKILNSYLITGDEIIKIKKELNSDYNLNNLKTNLNISFTIDQANDKKIISFLFPISRTKKIQLTKNLKTNFFQINQFLSF